MVISTLKFLILIDLFFLFFTFFLIFLHSPSLRIIWRCRAFGDKTRESKCPINAVINPIDFRLECVVNALCRGLSHASGSLSRLVLDMNLSGEQVSRVCEALRDCIQVQALHLPHLGCGCEGLASVAELLKERPLLALNLAGSWGAKNEDPSSSGISMGKTLPLLPSTRWHPRFRGYLLSEN